MKSVIKDSLGQGLLAMLRDSSLPPRHPRRRDFRGKDLVGTVIVINPLFSEEAIETGAFASR